MTQLDLDSPEVASILTDAIWRAHVANTPEEYMASLDGTRHTSNVCRIAAAHVVEQLTALRQGDGS